MSDNIKRVAVVGAGLMGHGISQVFLAAGHPVSVYDPDASRLAEVPDKIREICALLEQDSACLELLSCCTTLEQAVADADLVVEAGPEKLEVKREIFRDLARFTNSDTILATNTSAIPIGDIATAVEQPGRVVGTHFWNPPHLVRLVEVVQAATTTARTIARTMTVLDRAAMHPVHVRRDIPGFIGNRLQHAMKREAIALVADGVCSAETIDTVVKHSFGARLAVLGPMEQSDLVGLNLTLDIYKVLFPTLNNASEPPPLLVEKVSKGDLGMKTGQGFRSWTAESARQVRTRMQEYLTTSAKQQIAKHSES